jgi:FixJ family two-component response regulator
MYTPGKYLGSAPENVALWNAISYPTRLALHGPCASLPSAKAISCPQRSHLMTPTTNHGPTVYIVNADRRARGAHARWLRALDYSTRAFADGAALLRALRPSAAGCLLLDVEARAPDGSPLYERMLRDGPRLPVIVTAATADVAMAVGAMKAGAVEFLEQPCDRDTLADGVRRALAVDAQRRRRDAEFAALDERLQRLSARERETLDLILTGASNKAMAARLLLSERAVEMRRAAMMRKLNVRTLAELVELSLRRRMLSELRELAAGPRLG